MSCNVVADMIAEAAEFRDKVGALGIFESCSSGTKVTGDSGTMINYIVKGPWSSTTLFRDCV